MDLGLAGKVAMVAGASRGLGYAVARTLAAEGAHVSVVSRDASAIKEAAGRIEKETGGSVLAMTGDVSSAEAIDRWHAATLERFGGVDLVLTNSGGPPPGPALTFDDDGWKSAFELLVLSAIRLVRATAPTMARRGKGAVLMVTSSSVKEPIPNLGLSTVLRASVSALAKSLALDLAPQGIRVNQLIPGRIDTDRVRQLDQVNAQRLGIPVAEQRSRSMTTIPLGRYGEPDEFGRAAAFLLSDAASYITGATLQVDGGLIRSIV
jgi:3-oxoacyl-[acyl-carrier protein] reductase